MCAGVVEMTTSPELIVGTIEPVSTTLACKTPATSKAINVKIKAEAVQPIVKEIVLKIDFKRLF